MTSFYVASFVCLSALLVSVSGCRETPAQNETSKAELRASCFDVASADGAVHLLYGEPGKDKTLSFHYLKRTPADQQWPKPVLVPTSHAVPGNHHRGNDPQIAVHGNNLMALWTAKGGGPFGSGPLATAISKDGGKTWQAGPSPTPKTDDTKDIGYRFPATVAGDGAFHVVWIHAEGEDRSLRYSRLAFDSAQWSDPTVIDSTSCACCWNELKIDADGKIFVLYRDEKPRDMAFAVSNDRGQTWTRTGAVGDFKWEFNGCPHVGGGLDVAPGTNAEQNFLVSSVWSGHTNHSGAYVLTSQDNGQSWSSPTQLGSSKVGRHTDSAILSTTNAAVTWDEPSANGQAVFIAKTKDGGKTWTPPEQLSTSGAKAKYPRLLASNNQFIVLWTEEAETGAPLLRMNLQKTE